LFFIKEVHLPEKLKLQYQQSFRSFIFTVPKVSPAIVRGDATGFKGKFSPERTFNRGRIFRESACRLLCNTGGREISQLFLELTDI